IDFNMTRSDAVVAVGGGVVGDLSGFIASSYMRGVDFYNIPTTLLSMVDSSVGGKTAIDMHGVKNVVGAFYQPKGVIADVNLLTTLSKRQISNGLAESIKMSLTSDEKLFSLLESCDIEDNLEEIIIRSIDIKRAVVERDEKESGERKVLNFGHTLAHGIESANTFSDLYHGEAVAIGMVAVTNGEVKNRLISVLEKVNLPTMFTGDIDKALSFVIHDKKCKGDNVDVVLVSKIGSYEIKTIKVTDFTKLIKSSY
ncbi:MAG: 3-dehydroquinate synthase, partial [Clostridia bacterium]|nr:3-dehydroquinate synthase [Clostridia bacterium]